MGSDGPAAAAWCGTEAEIADVIIVGAIKLIATADAPAFGAMMADITMEITFTIVSFTLT
jgi:hypothetical protein